MREIRHWLEEEKTHKNMSMVAVNIIAHGSEGGKLLRSAQRGGRGWYIDDIVGALKDNKALIGKPKLLFINACRGGKYRPTIRAPPQGCTILICTLIFWHYTPFEIGIWGLPEPLTGSYK